MDVQAVKKRFKELTVLSNDKLTILYDRDTLNLRPLPSGPGKQLQLLIQSIDALPDDSPVWGQIDKIVNYFTDINVDVPEETEGYKEIKKSEDEAEEIRTRVDPSRYLHKLAINVTNNCNLACTYCYANKGLYGSPQSALMSQEDMEATIVRFAERFNYIYHVQFMGGEPSLNPWAIERCAEVFKRLADKGNLAGVPTLGMVSNGLKFTPKFWEVVKKHNVSITFSLDGPKEVHDYARVRPKTGKGSYDAVRANIQRARDRGIKTEFEATFSKRHLDCGIGMVDLCQWFFDELQCRVLHAPPMTETEYGTEPLALTVDDKIREYGAGTEWGLENLLKNQMLMPGLSYRFLRSFIKKRKNIHICPAGSGLLSVSTSGDVYPCWMYTDQKPFYMGNVKKDDFLGIRAAAVLDVLNKFDLHSHPECQKCWIQPVCFGCKGGDFLATKTIDKKTECDFMRAMVETFILKMCEIFLKSKVEEGKKAKTTSQTQM